MNNFSAITIVSWETRNWRHKDKAILWCKNYGLKPSMRNMYIGKLYTKECADLERKFKSLFAKKTEKFFVATLCKSCFDDSLFSDTIDGVRQAVHFEPAFELIQVDTELKSPKKPSK